MDILLVAILNAVRLRDAFCRSLALMKSDRTLVNPTVSNRHCLIFRENKGGDSIGVLEDLSGNGTFVNEAYVGRNKRRELHDGDEIAILDETRCVFRYPHARQGKGFHQQYAIQEQLGKGHFASVYLAVEKSTGMKYAVKKFEKRTGPSEKSRVEGLQQEIAVLMGVSHPNVLCLKTTFDEDDGVYIILELAVEGELFNLIVMKSKLSEPEARKVFIQLFQGIKYLVSLRESASYEFALTLSSARAEHRTPRHQTRKYPFGRQRSDCQDCGLWFGENHRRRVFHYLTVSTAQHRVHLGGKLGLTHWQDVEHQAVSVWT